MDRWTLIKMFLNSYEGTFTVIVGGIAILIVLIDIWSIYRHDNEKSEDSRPKF